MAPGMLKPFQLLEINIISAQDLEPVSKKMKTYARAWLDPNRRLSSRVDTEGNNNPAWNDKFVFTVDDDFLRHDASAVMIEIYASHWLRDPIVGTARVLVANLIPPPSLLHRNNNHIGMRFVALQVRRPSGRPQGILNIGVALLDGSQRSMPLYTQLVPTANRDLIMQDPPVDEPKNNNNERAPNYVIKPILRRSRSERSERVILDINDSPNGSIVAMPLKGVKKKGKASSVISGAELRDPKKPKGDQCGKANSVVSDSVYSKVSSRFYKKQSSPDLKTGDKLIELPANNKVVELRRETKKALIPVKGNSIWSDSEVGPSPSEVAAAMAQRRYPLDVDNQSSVLDGWSVDESVEGLRSKLERWRMDIPPRYETGPSKGRYRSAGQHRGGGGRKKRSGSGLFSCFGNICGYQCQCICGKPPRRKNRGSRYINSSVGTSPGRSFL